MRPYLLLLRFAVVNFAAFAVLVTVWIQGWVDVVLEGDVTRLTLVIASVFLAGFIIAAVKVWRCSLELNAVHADDDSRPTRMRWYRDLTRRADGEARGTLADCLRSRLYARIAVVRTMANSLVILGLIGTVIGFIIALSGVDPTAAADVGAIGTMVSTLIQGMAVALYTTLVGAVLHIWLMMSYQVLATGTVNLANAIIETVEASGEAGGPALEAA